MLAHGGAGAGGVESPRARPPVARPDRQGPREARRRPEGRRPRDVGRAGQEAGPPQGGQHPAHRLLRLRQDDPHARGRGPPGRQPRPRPALDRRPRPRQRARRGGRAGPPRGEAPAPPDGARPRAARGESARGAPHRAGHPRPRVRGRGRQDPQPGRGPAERRRHPRPGGSAHPHRERVGPLHPPRVGGGRHRERGLERPPLRLRRRLRGALRRRVLPGDRRQGPGRPEAGDRGGRRRPRARGAAVLSPRLAQDGGPLRVRGEPAVPLAVRRGGAPRAARRGGAPEDLRGGERVGAAAGPGLLLELRLPARGHRGRRPARRPRGGAPAAPRRPRAQGGLPEDRGPLEFDPHAAAGENGVVRVDLARVEESLARDRKGGSASTTSGWDQSFSG